MYSTNITNSVLLSFDIWKNKLFPSIFPFLIFSYLFINYGVSDVISEFLKPILSNKLNISDTCNFIIILSLLSGFPSSSKYIYDSYVSGDIDKKEADYLLNVCFFANPLFIISTIGVILLNDKKLGFIILISHYLSNFILAFLIRPKTKHKSSINLKNAFYKMKIKIINSRKIGLVVKDAVVNAVNVLMLLLGIITIFLILVSIMTEIINLDLYNKSIISGILEMTSGITQISNLNIDIDKKISIIAAMLSFGGISIHMQIIAIIDKFNFNYYKFLFYRIIVSIIAILLTLFLH